MLEVQDLAVAYGMHRALSGVSVHVEPGEIVVILGANGAGKSTLLKAVAGVCEGTVEGSVRLDGDTVSGMAADKIVEKGIAFVPEGRGIFGDLSVAENLMLGAYSDHARARQQENLNRVYELFPKLLERRSQISRTMSGGEQQMVAIGRAMMADPKILMLDEPSLGLSPLLCKELFQTLSHISETGLGVLLVEQNAKQSLAIADRGYLIENGEITGQDDAASLLNDPAVQAAYLGGAASDVKPASVEISPDTAAEHGEPVAAFPMQRKPAPAPQPADTLAGEDIAAMVARASSLASAATASPLRTPDSAIPVAPHATPGTGPVRDPEVARLLDELETAAQAARKRQPALSPSRNRKGDESYDNLPEIPVFRKSAVKIYRRNSEGVLVKQKEH